jgi:hypothetical protein
VSRSHSLMIALLPKGDEFAMNFEGLDTTFRHIRCFPQHFCEFGVNFVEKGRPRQWEPKELHRARPYRLGLRGSFHTSSALLVPFYQKAWRGMEDGRFGDPPFPAKLSLGYPRSGDRSRRLLSPRRLRPRSRRRPSRPCRREGAGA